MTAKYEDCESPPDIQNGQFKSKVDENEEYVTAIYKCNRGYKLVGSSQIICDLDTDEWDRDPPKCEEESK